MYDVIRPRARPHPRARTLQTRKDPAMFITSPGPRLKYETVTPMFAVLLAKSTWRHFDISAPCPPPTHLNDTILDSTWR